MAAAATQPRSARDAVLGPNAAPQDDRQLNLNTPRFFVQFGWSALQVDTDAIPNRYLLRGEITPCRSYPKKANLYDIREGELIPGSEETDKDGRTVYGKYWRNAFFEAERLVELEISTRFQQGLFEITALQGINSAVYARVNLNDLFYPDGLDAIPQTNEGVIAYLLGRVADIEANPPADIPPQYLPVVIDVGNQLIQAAQYNDQIQTRRLEFTHTCRKLSPSDELFKPDYDAVDEEMLLRTGNPRVHTADVQTAKALKMLAEPQSNEELKAMVELMRMQMEQQNAIMQALLADRQSPVASPVVSAPAETPKAAKKVKDAE